eukprot:1796589-Ditylum_brightwellii.AAC.1
MKVTIISVYRVCKNSLDQAGSTTCWEQQWRKIKKQGYVNPGPRKGFLQDFSTVVKSRIDQDEELIIGMDANDNNQDTSDFRKFYTNNDLVDVFKCLHPEITPPNTYQ